VIVNNRSTDRTAEIAGHYAGRDPRIQVLTNAEFVGVIQNHNIAFRQVAPEATYCKMVHADDWLFPECLERMVAVAETHRSVGVVGAYRLHGNTVELDGLPYPSTVVPGREVCRAALLDGLHIFGSPTATLIRAELIRRREDFYNEANIHADTEICYDLLRETDWGFVHQVLTYTRTHAEQNSRYTQRQNTFLLANLHDMLTYGPIYLNQDEYARRLAGKLDQYYRFLGKAVWQRRDQKFWDLHRNGLADLGLPFSRPRLYGAALALLLDYLLNPKRAIDRLLRGRRPSATLLSILPKQLSEKRKYQQDTKAPRT
jgi:glycosyltransferase involved in cell wall biosynthesis